MQPSFRKALRFARAAFVLLCLLALLCGCYPLKLLRKGLNGELPDQWEFPQTKWVCREVDLVIYMTDFEQNYMFGTYVVDGTSYRVDAMIDENYESIDLRFYLTTNIYKRKSEADPKTYRCSRVSVGLVCADYSYRKKTDTFVLTCGEVELDGDLRGMTFPEVLTFDRAEKVAETPKTRWVADELDLYLDAYSDVDVYMKGEITLDGKTYPVYAFETGNSDYYELYVNNSATYAASMIFRFSDDRIDAIRNDKGVMEKYWDPNLTRVTFHPAPIE